MNPRCSPVPKWIPPTAGRPLVVSCVRVVQSQSVVFSRLQHQDGQKNLTGNNSCLSFGLLCTACGCFPSNSGMWTVARELSRLPHLALYFNPVLLFFSSSSRVRNAFTRSRLLCNKLQLNVGHTSYAREVTHAHAMKIALRLGLMEISQVLTLRFNSLKWLPWGVGAVNFDWFSDSYAEHSW